MGKSLTYTGSTLELFTKFEDEACESFLGNVEKATTAKHDDLDAETITDLYQSRSSWTQVDATKLDSITSYFDTYNELHNFLMKVIQTVRRDLIEQSEENMELEVRLLEESVCTSPTMPSKTHQKFCEVATPRMWMHFKDVAAKDFTATIVSKIWTAAEKQAKELRPSKHFSGANGHRYTINLNPKTLLSYVDRMTDATIVTALTSSVPKQAQSTQEVTSHSGACRATRA